MNKFKRKQNKRAQAFWGALIGAGASLVGGLLGNNAAKKQAKLQANINDYNIALQDAQSATNAYNAALDYQQNYIQQFKQQARLGITKRLGGKNIMITDGGTAKRIGNNTYLLRGGSHEDINETGQTGIGINVGGNEIEAEGGEVAQRKGNSLRIYSAQPILGGISPAEAIMRGYNKDKVFNAQQRFKKNNGIKDDGSKAQNGIKVLDKRVTKNPNGTLKYNSTFTPNNGRVKPMGINSPEFQVLMGLRGLNIPALREATGPIINYIRGKGFNLSKEYPDLKSGLLEYGRQLQGIINPFMRHGGLTSKDRGSSKHPYPSVSSKDFAGGNRSYPIPTKADAIDALRLAGLHGRSDVRSKVYSKYPELRKKAGFGDWIKGLFNDNNSNAKNKAIYRSARGRVFNTFREASRDNYKYYKENPTYRYYIKGKQYHQKYGLRELNIPFQKENAITIRNGGRASGAVVSPNQLDSIAKYATRAGLSIPTALGLAIKESTLNNATDTKSAAKLRGLKVGTKAYENWTTGQHIQGTNSHRGTSSARNWINFHKDDDLNPYWETIDYLNKYSNISTIDEYNKRLLASERYDDRRANNAPRLTGGKKINVLEYGFRDYKNNPKGYNPKQSNYVQLVNQNARDIMKSPQIQQWYKNSRYTKGRKFNLGGFTNPPVEEFKCGGHIRPKAEDGMLAPIYSYGTNRRRLPSFAPIDVTPRAIPNFKLVSAPTNTKTPFDPNSVPFLGNQSTFKPATQDYIGLGIDTLAALGSGFINYNSASKTYLPERTSIIQASKLPTYYNINPQVEEIRRQRNKAFDDISHNTSSSVAAINRMNRIGIDSALGIDKLYATKENEENKMLTQDALNQQSVAAENAKLQADYEANKANILNAQNQAKADAINLSLSGLSQAWTNFAGSIEQRYDNRQKEAIIAATAKDPAVLSNAVQFGYNFSPEVLAAIYNSTDDDNLKSLALSQLSTKNRLRYGIR